MLREPYLIAELPSSISHARTAIQSREIVSFDGSEKRQRAELAVALDGVGLNIYEVSYAHHTMTFHMC